MHNKKVIVIGGGAAGLMAAGKAAERGLDVTVMERNPRMARKLLVTGKGRCNITNNCDVREFIANIPGNGRFLYSALSAFTPEDMMEFLRTQGLEVKTERGRRVFPVSDRAMDVVDTLVAYAKKAGARFLHARAVSLILENGVCTGVTDERGVSRFADAVVTCTGGLSYPGTGSTGDGYDFARQAGHTIVPARPSLVPLVSGDAWCAELQGLSLRNCGLKVEDTGTGKTVFTDFGELLFTHFGVSGPLALSASAHMRDVNGGILCAGQYRLVLDLKPALTHEQLDARLMRDIESMKNKEISSLLRGLMPQALCPVIAKLAEVRQELQCNSLTRAQRHGLAVVLKALPVSVEGFRPIEEAVITAGGVSVKEIDARTMQSKLVSGLYFAGEILDVDGYTGGYNLQIAFSTGRAAGSAAAEDIQERKDR